MSTFSPRCVSVWEEWNVQGVVMGMLLNGLMAVGGVAVAFTLGMLLIVYFDTKRRSLSKLLALANAMHLRGWNESRAAGTDPRPADAVKDADVANQDVDEVSKEGVMYQILLLVGMLFFMLIASIGLCGLVYDAKVARLEAEINNDIRVKAKQGKTFDEEHSGWQPEKFVTPHKDSLEVKEIPEGFSLYINDPSDISVWKRLSGTGKHSAAKVLGYATPPESIQIYFSYSGQVDVRTRKDSSVREMEWGSKFKKKD